MLVGAHVLVALQALVARRTDPLDSAVLSITMFHAGSAMNVIPDVAELKGTVRTLRPETRDMMEKLIAQVAESTAAAHEATAEVVYSRLYPPTVNHVAETGRAALAAAGCWARRASSRTARRSWAARISPSCCSRPGCFVMMGQQGSDKGGVPVHHPSYDFNDAMLPVGAATSPRWWSRNCSGAEGRSGREKLLPPRAPPFLFVGLALAARRVRDSQK